MSTTEQNRLLLNLIRKGIVSAVDHDKEVCRVETGELQTNWIRWLALAAGDTRDWNPPEVGEQVLVLSPGGDLACGVVLRGITSDDKPAPTHTPSAHRRAYPDGAVIEYDHAAHALVATLPAGATVLLQAPGAVTVKTSSATVEADQALIKANAITLDAANTTCTGNLNVKGAIAGEGEIKAKGDVKADGDVKAGAISLGGHHHKENGNMTDGPQ